MNESLYEIFKDLLIIHTIVTLDQHILKGDCLTSESLKVAFSGSMLAMEASNVNFFHKKINQYIFNESTFTFAIDENVNKM